MYVETRRSKLWISKQRDGDSHLFVDVKQTGKLQLIEEYRKENEGFDF